MLRRPDPKEGVRRARTEPLRKTWRRARRWWRREGGATLVEAVTATALLVTVLVPLGAGAVRLMDGRRAELEVEARAYAQEALETALHERALTDATAHSADGRWRVVREAHVANRQVAYRVRVYHRSRAEPLIELVTLRLTDGGHG